MKEFLFNYDRSLVSIGNSILKFYGKETYHKTLKELDEKLNSSIKHVSLVLIDGMGSYNLNEFFKDSFLNQNKLIDVSSTYPPTTANATIGLLTAKYPIETGWLGWQIRIKELNDNVILFRETSYFDDSISYPNYYQKRIPIKELDELIDTVPSKSFWPKFKGGAKNFRGELKETLKFIKNNEYSFTYTYYDRLDAVEHDTGVDSKETRKEFKYIDSLMKTYYKHLPKDSLLIVVADHGHINIDSVNMRENEKLMSFFEYMPSLEARSANFYIKNGMEEEFEEYFKNKFKDDFILMKTEDFINDGYFGISENRHEILSELGNYIALSVSNKGLFYKKDQRLMKGHHAGYTKEEIDVPLIILEK